MDPHQTLPPHQTPPRHAASANPAAATSERGDSPLDGLLEICVRRKASDLYLTYGSPPCIRIDDRIEKAGDAPLGDEDIQCAMAWLLAPEQLRTYQATLEMNVAIAWRGRSRFRVNVYRQQQHDAVVIRRVETEIPTLESLRLPDTYRRLAMMRRGLVLVAGQTGCGKSTSLAAMIGHRNASGEGHIITLEDPIEFVHEHRGCIISQRDIGIDTHSLHAALKNALRQQPDVILIGEIRDRETMEYAINFSETGHLCLATLHANNASQAIERAINFFPEEVHQRMLYTLSNNLRGILAQRLIAGARGGRRLLVETMLNEGLVSSLIQEGKFKDIRGIMEKNRALGMQTFDQALLELYTAGQITESVALAEADNASVIRLAVKQKNVASDLHNVSAVEQRLKDNPF